MPNMHGDDYLRQSIVKQEWQSALAKQQIKNI
jgi:hypothetical protein